MNHGKTVAAFARGGLSGKGITCMLIAALAFGAAPGSAQAPHRTTLEYDSSEARDLGAALRALQQQPTASGCTVEWR